MLNIPTLITLSRLVLMVPLVIFMMIPAQWAVWVAFWLYILGAATDWLDGLAARFLNQTSDFGAMLDQIVDKIFVSTILITFIAIGTLNIFWAGAVMILLAREIFISGLREFMGSQEVIVPVSRWGKWKTAAQMVALGLLILSPISIIAHVAGLIALLLAMLLSVHSGFDYVQSYWQILKESLNS
jgi:cardiolipin synthase